MADRARPGQPTKGRAGLTRQKILDAAGQEFEARGYGGASVNRIIAAAGATKGAFYYHFTSKQDLAKKLLQSTLEIDLAPQSIKLQEIVDTGMLMIYRTTREPGLRAALRLSIARDAPTTYGTPWPDWITLSIQQLTEAKAQGELGPDVDIPMTAHQLAGAWAGLTLITQVVDQNLDEIEDRMCTMYKNLLTAVGNPRHVMLVDFSRDRGRQVHEASVTTPHT
ncbi:TetR/AcrR family transcriptional regulator [Streptomyces sp. NPDC005752]|uniref:TetR/AcrR family transcriptional regulator n=1 Tax=Streptomyces sp. NPDC005752 TaxID=3157065 RepID=UPI0033FC4C50